MKTTKVSVIVPVYNAETYLNELLDTLENQTLKEIELLFIDDGSTDNTKDILTTFCSKKTNASFISQLNQGPSIARNKGLSLAKGEYIFFADADDKLPLQALEKMYNLATHHHADLIIGGTERFNGIETWKVKSHYMPTGPVSIEKERRLFWTMGPCNKLYRQELIKDLSFPVQLTYAEDLTFVMQCYLKAEKIVTLDETVYYYRTYEKGQSTSLVQVVHTQPFKVIQQIKEVWDILLPMLNRIREKEKRQFIELELIRRLLFVDIVPPLKNITDKKQKTKCIKNILSIFNTLSLKTKLFVVPYFFKLLLK